MPEVADLNLLIAEKVMGQTDFDHGDTRDNDGQKECSQCSAEASWEAHGWPGPCVRAYSTDISAAMQVVEKMREKGWRFHMSDIEGGMRHELEAGERKDGENLLVTFHSLDARKGGGSFGLQGKEAEAICLAALKVMEWKP